MKGIALALCLVIVGCKAIPSPLPSPTKPNHLVERVRANDLAYVLGISPNDPELERSNSRDDKPLWVAIHMRKVDLVKALLTKGASTRRDEYGQDPLEAAIIIKDPTMVALLLSHGATTGRIGFGDFPLHIACRFGNAEIIQLLLRHGANPDEISPTNGETPLEFALQANQLEAAKAMISAGAKPEARELYLDSAPAKRIAKELGIVTSHRQFDQAEFLRQHPGLRPNR